MATALYSTMATQHLAKDDKLTKLEYVRKVKVNAIAQLEKNKQILLDQEYNYIKSTINKCAVPIIQLLVKDNNKKDKGGNYPTRLVVPTKNCTAGFPHVGQHSTKKILDKNKIDYSKQSTTQASDLKQKLGKLNIQKSKHTVILIDAEKMYPSIKFGQIQKLVNYFLRDAPEGDKEKSKKCLDLVWDGKYVGYL